MKNKLETMKNVCKKKPYCCEIKCTKDAEFNVQDLGGDKTYEDYTHSCSVVPVTVRIWQVGE